jgi:hypothetical protein
MVGLLRLKSGEASRAVPPSHPVQHGIAERLFLIDTQGRSGRNGSSREEKLSCSSEISEGSAEIAGKHA